MLSYASSRLPEFFILATATFLIRALNEMSKSNSNIEEDILDFDFELTIRRYWFENLKLVARFLIDM